MQTEQVISSNDVETGMVKIPAGYFYMGAEGWGEFEAPIHEVYLDDFWMDINPITNYEFSKFVQATQYVTTAEKRGFAWGYKNGKPSEIKGLNWSTYATPDRDNHPVVLVSWYDANSFAKWKGKRLPTEAEFEKSARGGLYGKLYPWGDDAPSEQYCNFNKTVIEIPPTTPIESFPPNAYGLYDMCGNVWNWCQDWFGEQYYADFSNGKAGLQHLGPEYGSSKVRRGASFNIIQNFRLRCSNRGAYLPDQYAVNIGFRCAKSI